MLTGTCFWQVQLLTFGYTGTTESIGSLKVSENVQSDIWDNGGEFQPGLSYAHLLLYIFGFKCVPRSNSQTFSVPEQTLLNPDLGHSWNTDVARYCACLLSHKCGQTEGCEPSPACGALCSFEASYVMNGKVAPHWWCVMGLPPAHPPTSSGMGRRRFFWETIKWLDQTPALNGPFGETISLPFLWRKPTMLSLAQLIKTSKN